MLYVRATPTWALRRLYIVGALCWLGVLWGYGALYSANKPLFVVIAPVVIFLVLYHLLSYAQLLYYQQFDIRSHQRRVQRFDPRTLTKARDVPLVDIFLPICGEDARVLDKTFEAVAALRYPRTAVYVLDDKGVAEHRRLALQHGFTYLSRRKKGHLKKAGNLKYGLEHSRGDFVAIFDADFAPHPDFITELLPYMRDPKVGIVQSPQYFQADTAVHRRSPLEYGAAQVQEDFYRYIQVARDRLGAPVCCGSNALYRRAALDAIGGIVQIEHSEDAYTGFELLNRGWKVRYLPIILAVGLCPSDFQAYFHQQHRWASGSLQLMLDQRFWRSNLSLKQKLCFIAGFLYYLSHPISLLFSFQIFALLFFFHANMRWEDALPFVPSMLFALVFVPRFRIAKGRLGTFVTRHAYLYSSSHAFVVTLLRRTCAWQPAGTARRSVSREYRQQLHLVAGYFFLYVSLVAVSLAAGVLRVLDAQEYTLLFWIFYNLCATSLVLYHSYAVVDRAKKLEAWESGNQHAHLRWRLRTAGAYGALLAVVCGAIIIR